MSISYVKPIVLLSGEMTDPCTFTVTSRLAGSRMRAVRPTAHSLSMLHCAPGFAPSIARMLSRTEDFSGTPLSLPCLFPLGRFRRALGPCGTEEGVLRGRRVLVFSSSSPRKFPSAVPTEAVSEPPYSIAPLSAGYNPQAIKLSAISAGLCTLRWILSVPTRSVQAS